MSDDVQQTVWVRSDKTRWLMSVAPGVEGARAKMVLVPWGVESENRSDLSAQTFELAGNPQ